MSISWYDLAAQEKIQSVFPAVVFAEVDEAIQERQKQDPQGRIGWPFISVWRRSTPPGQPDRGNFGMIRRGVPLNSRPESFQSLKDLTVDYVSSIPVQINYEYHIWGKRKIDVDDIYRELLHLFTHDPQLYVKIKAIPGVPIQKIDTLVVDYQDFTEISRFKEIGRLYRTMLAIQADHAQLFYDNRVSLVASIPVTYTSLDGTYLDKQTIRSDGTDA